MRLQTKILLIVSSLTLSLGAPLLLTVRSTMHRVLTENVARRGSLLVNDLAGKAVAGVQQNSEALLLPLLQSAQENSGAGYAMVLNTAGQVLAHTNVAEKGKTYTDAETLAALLSPALHSQISRYKNDWVMDVSAPVWSANGTASAEDFLLLGGTQEGPKKRIGTVCLALPLKEANEIEFRLFRQIAWIVLVVGAIGLVLILLSMRRMLRPIPLLSRATSRIGRGEYGATVPILSKDELGMLAEDFNRMIQVLAETTVSKDFLGSILSNMIDPLIVMDMDSTIRMANQATLDLLGYSQKELEGQRAPILFLPKGEASGAAEQETLIMKGFVRNLELEFLKKSGDKVPILFSSSVMKNQAGQPAGIIAVAKDVTERKRLESIIRQSDKMSAVGQLAAGVAHEINNPLGVILGFAQAAIRRLQPGEALEMPLKSIEKEAVRCKNLVQDLLTFSRVSKVEREPMDLNKTIEGALSLVMARARTAQVEVRRELAPDLPRVLGNPNQIQQVIVNIANNAFDAMGDRGVLTVRTETLQDGPLSWICLKVTDTGTGIPHDVLPRIFEPFFTTKPVGQGTGLGLSLIHEMMKKHSGTIDVESRPGCTAFCLKFPVRMVQGSVHQNHA